MTALRVRAIEPGYYGSIRRDPGDKKYGEFVLTSAAHFSASWMEPIGWDVDEEKAKEKGEGKQKIAAPKPVAPAAPAPVRASTETVVTIPADKPKQADPITGKDI